MGRPADGGPVVPYGSQFSKFDTKDSLPEGAVIITDTQMIQLVNRTIRKWNPSSEMWPFTYNLSIIAGATGFSGIMFNQFMRSKFRIGNFSPMLTLGPVCLLPTLTSLIIQGLHVTPRLMLQKDECPSCIQIRSAMLMVCTGVLQPGLLSLFACSVVAKYRHTVVLPPFTEPRRLAINYLEKLRPFRLTALGLTILNVATGVFLTQQQGNALIKVHKRLETGY